jgi:hypothetical protein
MLFGEMIAVATAMSLLSIRSVGETVDWRLLCVLRENERVHGEIVGCVDGSHEG